VPLLYDLNMSGLFKRFRQQSAGDTIEGTEIQPNNHGSEDTIEKHAGESTAHDVPEAEVNQKLSIFEKAHRWDPNLDNSQLDDIDDAVNTRDLNAEGRLYDEVFENSPYPEVSLLIPFLKLSLII
jgi:hypothetical protein